MRFGRESNVSQNQPWLITPFDFNQYIHGPSSVLMISCLPIYCLMNAINLTNAGQTLSHPVEFIDIDQLTYYTWTLIFSVQVIESHKITTATCNCRKQLWNRYAGALDWPLWWDLPKQSWPLARTTSWWEEHSMAATTEVRFSFIVPQRAVLKKVR